MDWSNETYVKVYVRDTDDDLALSWEARALWDRLLRKFDQSGFFPTRRASRGVTAASLMPFDVVERALAELLRDGRLVEVEGGYLARNFIEAQTANKSDKLRQREARDRRRAGLTAREPAVTTRDATVTDVTLCSASSTLQSETPARAHAIPPAAVPLRTTEPPKIENAIAPRPAISTAAEIRSPGQDPRSIGRLAVELWRGVSADRLTVAAELGLANVLPFPECDSPREPGAFRELRDRLREEGGKADVVATHVRAALLERARADKSIEWLAEKAFTEGGWRTARSYVLGAAKRVRPGDPAPTMRLVRRDDDAPPPTGGDT